MTVFKFWCETHDKLLGGDPKFIPTRVPGYFEVDLSDMWCDGCEEALRQWEFSGREYGDPEPEHGNWHFEETTK